RDLPAAGSPSGGSGQPGQDRRHRRRYRRFRDGRRRGDRGYPPASPVARGTDLVRPHRLSGSASALLCAAEGGPLVITASPNGRLGATLPLQIEGSSGRLDTIDTVIDTGFTGDLTLSGPQISALGLAWLGEQLVQLGDSSMQKIDVYDALLMWDNNPIRVRIQ